MFDELPERAAVRRRAGTPEPGGAPKIEDTGPAPEWAVPSLEGRQRLFLCANDCRGFIRLIRDLNTRVYNVLQRGRELGCFEKRQWLYERRTRAAPPRLAPDVIQRGADQAVAGNQPMIQERERLVCGKRRQPQRKTRELHRRPNEIDAKET